MTRDSPRTGLNLEISQDKTKGRPLRVLNRQGWAYIYEFHRDNPLFQHDASEDGFNGTKDGCMDGWIPGPTFKVQADIGNL